MTDYSENYMDYDNEEWLITDGELEECRIQDATRIEVPSGVKEIGVCAFSDCYMLECVYIPKSVQIVDDGAFEYCYNLKEIVIENPNVVLESGCFSETEKLERIIIGGHEVKTIVVQDEYGEKGEKGNCLEKYIGIEEKYVVDNDIKKINKQCFSNLNTLKEVEIPYNVVEIGDNAFDCCENLTKVQIDEGIKIIGTAAFNFCRKISELRIPQSVEVIRDKAFWCFGKKQTIYIPEKFKGKGIKLFQKWRRGCFAKIIYY